MADPGHNRRHDDAVAPSAQQNVPIPDPSIMTTRQLLREVFGLRELLETRLSALEQGGVLIRGIIETRLDGMDKAIRVLQDIADKFPQRIDEKIESLREIHDQRFTAMIDTHAEKFNSIQTQFKERDVRTEQSSKDSKVAVDAALQAAKEAVGEQNKSSALAIAKSETATTKQIDQLGNLMTAMSKGFDDKIDDLKDRLARGEAAVAVTSGKGQGLKDGWGYIVAAVGLALALWGFANKPTAPVVVPPTPQIIYSPAPAGALLPTTPPATVPR